MGLVHQVTLVRQFTVVMLVVIRVVCLGMKPACILVWSLREIVVDNDAV